MHTVFLAVKSLGQQPLWTWSRRLEGYMKIFVMDTSWRLGRWFRTGWRCVQWRPLSLT